MDSFFVYIIYSPLTDRFYIGQTQNLQERLDQHNTGYFKNAHTHSASDWEFYHTIACQSRKQAVRIESHIKKAKKRKYLHDLKKYPEMSQKLKEKYES
ncbi:GIY-YIG nuclease family protein [Algoriphagus machipongonensis]|uniref:Putative GIY-YIG catalytic domain protein n=1 Tax=Algoriphagus machipongonensis TaxID=388413 RepID=E2RUG0_9BACT|nr:GIY-YIG nuclease family protein [Algoriphagus machipongonensis]EFQ79234.1 putative GIY-YIG catalytic domain protein [Algoriphagus machipongonensis]EFQ79235.1 putative GIY-YIG catalytic domain protein [Algoriphagus machipongonensis]